MRVPGYSKPAPEFQAELDLHFGPSTERYDALVEDFFLLGEDPELPSADGDSIRSLRILRGIADSDDFGEDPFC